MTVDECPIGYIKKIGSVGKFGSITGPMTATLKECAKRCNISFDCQSFEHSELELLCNLNKERVPTTTNQAKDYTFCSKIGKVLFNSVRYILFY